MELHPDKKKERQPGMTPTAKYKRILLKLSGEALMGDDPFGINRATIERIVGEISQVAALGLEIAVVIGGGNIFRGVAPGDAAAALRGTEIGAEMVLKATKVDGIYTADPKLRPDAKRYDKLSFDEAMIKNLRVMDATAFALCRDQKLPITVFSILKVGAMKRVVTGEKEGTLVYVSS